MATIAAAMPVLVEVQGSLRDLPDSMAGLDSGLGRLEAPDRSAAPHPERPRRGNRPPASGARTAPGDRGGRGAPRAAPAREEPPVSDDEPAPGGARAPHAGQAARAGLPAALGEGGPRAALAAPRRRGLRRPALDRGRRPVSAARPAARGAHRRAPVGHAEVGLSALQVWQALSESQGRGRGERELTILFTDLVEFSAWALEAGDTMAVDLLRRVGQVVEPPIEDRGGRIVKRLGDGLMAVFTEPGEAVEAALEAVDGPRGGGGRRPQAPACGRACTSAARERSAATTWAWT